MYKKKVFDLFWIINMDEQKLMEIGFEKKF